MTTLCHLAQLSDGGRDDVLTVRLSGRLTRQDYETLVPEIERVMRSHGSVRLLVVLDDFHGWTAAAAWEDTKFGLRHYSDIDRVAIVGDRAWEKGIALLCKPFTTAEVRYFDAAEVAAAKRWVAEKG
jgi:SpoIIAA-like